MAFVGTLVVILLFILSLLMLVWIYRPSSKKIYDHCSKIPLHEEKYLKMRKKSGRK